MKIMSKGELYNAIYKMLKRVGKNRILQRLAIRNPPRKQADLTGQSHPVLYASQITGASEDLEASRSTEVAADSNQLTDTELDQIAGGSEIDGA